ncbi:MAG: prepilin-type N-terminal cleavage/methylation domain-containing protein [Limnobacter sp.]|uniref:prepilin-type N-terminal cleavage/methylation domain-containing protein n=1 Tax=Limnobacter sp. TaxID=2003368 RepID=UPI0022BA9ECE|nr:prepilin-type N-terminal cleavage/methylation domain-containing protein [Limnobacter sp.]MCZ8016602.1 prepilin-type N-terminal cleavage/methylation domain-containing protein [Limnobacter sp.]
MNRSKGFGLPELMTCVVILAIVAVVVLPSFSNYYKRAALVAWMGALSQAEVAIRTQSRRDSSSFQLSVQYDPQTDRWCIAGVRSGSNCACNTGGACDVVAQSFLANKGVFAVNQSTNWTLSIPDAMRKNTSLAQPAVEQFPLSVDGNVAGALLRVAFDELGRFDICARNAREYLSVVKTC